MKLNKLERIEILDLEKQFPREIQVQEKTTTQAGSIKIIYSASIPYCEIKKGCCLYGIGKFDGHSVDECLEALAEAITNQLLVFDAYETTRKEIKTEIVIHTRIYKNDQTNITEVNL